MSGSINFNVIPGTLRVPGVYTEVDATQSNSGQVNQNTLIIAQKQSIGTATGNNAVLVNGLGDAAALFGNASMLTNMVATYRETDTLGTLYCLPLVDNPNGTQASGNLVISGPATGSGTLSLYFAGNQIPVGVTSGQSSATIAAAIVTQIDTFPTLPFTATVNSSTVTITALHKGVAAGDIDISLNFLGPLNNESTPAGVGVTINPVTGGTQDPDVTTALSNLTNTNFDFIVFPYTGTSDLNEFSSFIGDLTGRWSYLSQQYGMGWTALRGTYSSLVTWGLARNDQHVTALGYLGSPTPAYEVATSYCAMGANSLRVDPALPLGAIDGLAINMLAPSIANQFDVSEINTLLYSGVSTILVEPSGTPRICRAITTYQLTSSNTPDDSYLDVETLYTLQYVIRFITNDLKTKFGRKKLVDNGQRIPFGQNTVTPQIILNEGIADYNLLAQQGLVQNTTAFAAAAQAQISGVGTVALFLPIQPAGQLYAINQLVQFKLASN